MCLWDGVERRGISIQNQCVNASHRRTICLADQSLWRLSFRNSQGSQWGGTYMNEELFALLIRLVATKASAFGAHRPLTLICFR